MTAIEKTFFNVKIEVETVWHSNMAQIIHWGSPKAKPNGQKTLSGAKQQF